MSLWLTTLRQRLYLLLYQQVMSCCSDQQGAVYLKLNTTRCGLRIVIVFHVWTNLRFTHFTFSGNVLLDFWNFYDVLFLYCIYEHLGFHILYYASVL